MPYGKAETVHCPQVVQHLTEYLLGEVILDCPKMQIYFVSTKQMTKKFICFSVCICFSVPYHVHSRLDYTDSMCLILKGSGTYWQSSVLCLLQGLGCHKSYLSGSLNS